MGSKTGLTTCMKKGGAELSRARRLALFKQASALNKTDGLDPLVAAKKAVEEQLAAVRALIAKITSVEEAVPVVETPPPADDMGALIEGSDAQAIAQAAYKDVREVESEDFPVVLADDRLIRLPVLMAEQKAIEANLKKLKFRITDRSQESGVDGRMLISAIYRPEKGGIGDVGEQMGGGRKQQNPPDAPKKDASEKELDDFLAALHPKNYLNPDANAEQSFGAMMFKEALMENVGTPLAFISEVIKNSYGGYWGEKSPRNILKRALTSDEQRTRVTALAKSYVERLQLLQTTLTPYTRVGFVLSGVFAKYSEDGSRYRLTDDGRELHKISAQDPLRLAENLAPKLEPIEDTTDQTHRAKKKDPDVPARLERIVRIGMKDHRAGKNIVDDDFLTTFGFKGLEFGNWVNQTERQENLNLAYDSLMDMADLTGLSPKSVGIAARLGFAIGSRGQNPRAAAHFEPDNNVMNLTKTKGNGTVGHEWFHALDHNASAVQSDAVGIHARTAVNTLAAALKTRMDAGRADAYLRGLLRSSSTDSNRNTPPKEAVFEAIKGSRRYRYSTPDAYSQADTTHFYSAASRMDDGASKKYWSSPVEMLARGFETFLYDKSKGGSPYLVGPSRADGAMTEKNGYKGNPYPSGEERTYVAGLFQDFIDQIDGETLAYKFYTPAWTVKEVKDFGWTVLDQHGIDGGRSDGRMLAYDNKDAANKAAKANGEGPRYLNAEKIAHGKLNKLHLDFMTRIDAIMEEMGLERWPELKDGSLAESMFFHLRQGWWPKDNQALKVYAAKAHGLQAKEIDLLKLKDAQEDFEAALGRYAAQRVVDLRGSGSDSRAIYDYLVGLYNSQPNLDVRTATSQMNMAFSTPLPIGFVAGVIAHVTSKSSVFDPTGGNGMLALTANPKRVITIELEPHRAQNLRLMEYGKVIEGDATKKIASDIRAQEADVALMNPPFGPLAQSVAVPSWDGRSFMMGKIDQLIAAQGMKAMADNGRAVIILGAHKIAGTVTSTDRVFLNWLYSNYNVADHFEVDGALYKKQGAEWPLRVLVVAGRKESVSAFPVGLVADRVYDFDQLWSRSDDARQRAEQVLVGAGVASDGPGSANPDGTGVPAGDPVQAPGAPGASRPDGSGPGDGDVADGGAGRGNQPNGRPGESGGSTAGGVGRGGDGAGGVAVDGKASGPGRGNGGRGGAVGPSTGGLSGLSDEDIDALLNGAVIGKARSPRGEPSGEFPSGARTRAGKPKLGKSILDDIEGLGDLLGQLGAEFTDPDDTPPTTPTERKKRVKNDGPIVKQTVFKPGAAPTVAPLLLGYQKAPAINTSVFNLLSAHEHSEKTLARAIRAALDYQLEQTENPTAPAEKVSSRAMFSRQVAEDAEYAKVQPILAAIWQHLGKTIADVGQRIKTMALGVAQKFGAKIMPLVKRFLIDVRSEEAIIPNGKKPIRAEAIDNEAQVVYRGRSAGDSAGIFVPRNQATALERAFDNFEAENGEVDQFVMSELGYASLGDMHKGPKRGQSQGLAGYQVDALALAISSMKRGDGFIIGDDTGVGKGRTAAAIIAWAVKNGKVPIFSSYKADLYSAMHDDLTDIGMETRVKPLPTDSDAVIRNRAGKSILKNNAKTTKKALEHIIAKGELPEGHNALFTTYFQNNTANKRREAIQRLVRDGKAVLIMDEAHNAAGESNTNQFFMGLLTGSGLFGGDKDNPSAPPDDWVAPQTTYLTATYAKRPSNMPVYIRTQLRHAANTPEELVTLFGSGGDVLQQIASEMLVSSGSMIRRERSYAGVKFNYVTDEENAPRDSREVDAATAVLRRVVYADRAFGAWVKTGEGDAAVRTLVPPGFAASFAGSGADIAINKSEFTSVVHNYVGQLLLATKVAKGVDTAIEALNAGQKPVLTLQNTMEAALNDYVSMSGISEGDPLTGFGWQSILRRGLNSARRVTFDAGTGNKADNRRVLVPVEMLPPFIAAEFKKASELIAAFKSNLPGSPIDALRHRLSQYQIVETKGDDGLPVFKAMKNPPEGSKARSLVAVEVTGREFGVDYSTDVPTYMRREDPDNLEIIRGFQGGTIDVVILNSSGSTGISLHASEMARDQRPRHMVILQPNPDIAVFKQTTGRIHRTGQVEWPTFTVLATGIPAERRQLAMLKKKINSLFSNTSSGEGTTGVDAVDFLNQYGDVITTDYLKDNEDVAAFIGITPAASSGDAAGSDISRKASGRAALLSVDEQRDYFDTIEHQFLLEIEQRNATGTNALERRAMDFQASPTEMQTLEEGMDESNPFTSTAYLTKQEINVVGDIPSPEKVRNAIATALDGGSASAALKKLIASLETRYDEAKNQLALRRAEVAAGMAHAEVTEQEKTALTERLKAVDKIIQGFATRRETTHSALLNSYLIGNGAYEMTVGDVESQAVIVGVSAGKSTSKVGNPFAPSNIIIHFQRNVPAGRLSVPLSKLESSEYTVSRITTRPDLDEWFGLRSVSGGRKERWIASGNLLRARSIVQGGEILLHTMKGSTEASPIVQGGILMPQAYAPGMASKSDFTIRYAGASVDYVLALLKAAKSAYAERYDSDEARAEAAAYGAAAKFQADVDAQTLTDIRDSGSIIGGPGRGWSVSMSRYGSDLRLYVGKDFPKIIRSKELKALGIELAKKRGDSTFSAKLPDDAEKIKAVVKLLAWQSPMIAPDAASDIARKLSQQHFQADNAPKSDKPLASRGDGEGGQSVEAVQAHVDAIVSTWQNAPDVVVVASLGDKRVPASIRDEDAALRSDGAAAGEGFYNPEDGKVYMIADKLGSAEAVARVLAHESLGHYGLRGHYGDGLGAILDRLSSLNPAQVRAAAKRLGYDFEKIEDRRLAAEEVLAYMAQNTPTIGWVMKAVAAVRSWLREHIPLLGKLELSDAEIIRDHILPARRFVETGSKGGPKGGNSPTRPVASRSIGAALTSSMNSVRDVKLPAGYLVSDLLNATAGTPGRLGWWHKSVGTMYHLAQRSAPFKRVYDTVQSFLNDVSYYAAEAADLAPSILPKLEHFRDVWKSPLSAEDGKAVSAPVFEGTLSWGRDERGVARPITDIEERMGAVSLDDKAHKLLKANHVTPEVLRMWQGLPMDRYEAIIEGKFEREFMKPGVVFTPEELKKHFKLTDAQIGQYQEVRAAISKSINDLAVSGMLRFGGADTAEASDEALAAPDAAAAAVILRDHLFALAAAHPARADALNDSGNKMIEKADKAKDLMDRGYAPLSRFGQYTLDVVDADGTRVYFGLFESATERSKMARKMGDQFPGSTINQGTVSDEAYKLFAGVSPETLELFGEMLGLESDGDDATSQAFQTYLKLARSSRDSMKRLIKRKGIAGFSEDAGRVLAGFVYSNARQTASNLHMKALDRAVNDIPQGQGQLQDEAVKLREYVKQPQEEAQAFRGILFAQYLGGSVASAMVNATQPFAVTFPYLSQFGGVTKAARQMVAAVKDATKPTTGDADLDAALHKAVEEGIVSPQETHALQAQAMGRAQLKSGDGTRAGNATAMSSNALSKFSLAWGKVFGLAEQYNRKVTFIATYRTAIDQGINDPAAFAAKAVAETQFTYNKGNKPRWARGAVGSTLFTFKQYSVNYVELLYRMANAGAPGSEERAAGRKAALLALAVLFLLAGGEGIPFTEDVQDVVTGAMQRLGYNFDSKQALKRFLTEQIGNDGAEILLHGLSGLPGAPIDVSGRLGLGNLIPGTGLFTKKADHTRDVVEVAGAAGDFIKRGATALGELAGGHPLTAAHTISPVAARNLFKAYEMATTGEYRDAAGRKVIDVSAGEAVAKGIGFQPRSVDRVQDATGAVQGEKNQYTLAKSEIHAKWALAMVDGTSLDDVKADVASWNAKNPEAPIKPNMPAILKRVREMRKTKEQRIADTAPKAIRARVREELAETLH